MEGIMTQRPCTRKKAPRQASEIGSKFPSNRRESITYEVFQKIIPAEGDYLISIYTKCAFF